MADNEFHTVTNHDFGYSLSLPSTWRDVGPDIYNSVFEVARYLRNQPHIHDGIVNLFWDIPGDSPCAAAERGDPDVFDLSRESLEKEGVRDISISETRIGDRDAVRLDHAYHLRHKDIDIEHWASRSYFMSVRDTLVCLNMGTSSVDDDRELYDRIAGSFSVIEDAASIVIARGDDVPDDFLAELLESIFDYRRDRARQRVVRMKAQGESVVALVEAVDAPSIVASVARQSAAAGYSLDCRIAGA